MLDVGGGYAYRIHSFGGNVFGVASDGWVALYDTNGQRAAAQFLHPGSSVYFAAHQETGGLIITSAVSLYNWTTQANIIGFVNYDLVRLPNYQGN